jgi:hypothetical protein
MRKALVVSIVLATFWIPLAAARDPNPQRGLRRVRKRFAIFCVAYVFSILYVLPRL